MRGGRQDNSVMWRGRSAAAALAFALGVTACSGTGTAPSSGSAPAPSEVRSGESIVPVDPSEPGAPVTDPVAPVTKPSASPPTPVGEPIEPPVASRFPGLARVGNLSMWFTRFWAQDNPAGDPGFMTDEDIDRLVAQGFTGVRLPIDPELVADGSGELDPQVVVLLLDALDRLQRVGLAVVVDLHVWLPDEWESPERIDQLRRIWEQLAPVLADRDPALTFLELHNEPGWWGDPVAWGPHARTLYDTARTGAPGLPLVLSGPMSSWIDGLDHTEVLDDPNVVYTIHIYDPFPFTHQGADWTADPGLIAASALPFPATPERCAAAAALQPDEGALATLEEYCAGGYDEAWIADHIGRAVAWADTHGIELFLGEFGVSPVATVDDAARWFAAVAGAAESAGIGWAVWSLDAAMGIRRADAWATNLATAPDPLLMAALGLTDA